jgi:hypothetical protein
MILTMRTPSLYLDTSVLGGYFDEEWKQPTQELWRQREAGLWVFLSSVLVRDEIENAPAHVRNHFAQTFTEEESLLAFDEEMETLAEAYVAQGVVTQKYIEDAGHVAIATVCRADYLVSWNFKHLVNVEREKGFNAINLLRGWQPIRIVNPLELIYGNRVENL